MKPTKLSVFSKLINPFGNVEFCRSRGLKSDGVYLFDKPD